MRASDEEEIHAKADIRRYMLTVRPKYPWDNLHELRPLQLLTLFRKHIGEPAAKGAESHVDVLTGLALDRVHVLGLLISELPRVCESQTSGGVERDADRMRQFYERLENVFPALSIAAENGKQFGFDQAAVSRFTMTPPERVRLFGRIFDSAHAAAQQVIPGLIDLWGMTQRLVGLADPVACAETTLAVYLDVLQQLESTPADELLRQIVREHKHNALREGATANAASYSAGTETRWSASHTKKVLADFFAVDVRLLMRELKERGICCKKCSRQGYRIDLNTLDATRRTDFLAALESR